MTTQEAVTQIETILADAKTAVINVVNQITPSPTVDLVPIIALVEDLLARLKALIPV